MRNVFNKNQYTFSLGIHDSKEVIWIHFPYNQDLQKQLKESVKAGWSATHKCWYCTDTVYYRQLFGITPKSIGQNAFTKIHPVNQPAYQHFMDTLILKGFSESTIKTYTVEFAQLLYILKAHPVESISDEQLRSYFLYCHKKLKLSENQIHSRMNSVKFYFEQVLHRKKVFYDIPRPKKPSQLPKALSKKEVERIIGSIDNIKHRLIVKLCYGMGLRVSEVVRLKIEDIDSTQMQVRIENAKGKKDRYVNLPASILPELREYYRLHKPQHFLFEGQFGRQYNIRSAQAVFKTAMNKAGIIKSVGIHSLRHSYATHLLEFGVDVTFIQKLMGHKDIKTTMTYLKITDRQLKQVKSPLDM